MLPAGLQDRLGLSDEQRRRVEALQEIVDTQLNSILTPEQMQMLNEVGPPPGEPGPGGPPRGDGGPGRNRPRPNPTDRPARPANMEALIQASTRLETVEHLHTLFDLTFAEIRPNAADNRLVDVLWSDIRFCWPADCALWFGGTFDASTGALREQVVLVGSLRQIRPPP